MNKAAIVQLEGFIGNELGQSYTVVRTLSMLNHDAGFVLSLIWVSSTAEFDPDFTALRRVFGNSRSGQDMSQKSLIQ